MADRTPPPHCTPLEGIEPLLLGMTLDDATAALGPANHLFEDQREVSWTSGFRCYFSQDWHLLQISLVGVSGAQVQIGHHIPSEDFTEAERQLVSIAGEAFRDPKEYLTVLPGLGLAIWSEEGVQVDDFGCTTRGQCDIQWPGWSTDYLPLRPA